MRLKNLIYYSLALLFIGGNFSCEQEELPDPTEPTICPNPVYYPENAKLLRTYYGAGDENGNTLLEEYEYGENGKISKVTTPYYENGAQKGPLQYEAYTYGSDDRLAEVATYSRTKDGEFQKRSLLRYTYTSEGLKEKEILESLPDGPSTMKRFYYKEGKTERCELYAEGELVNTTLYKYDEKGRISKETTHYEGKPISYILYSYEKREEGIEEMVEYNVGEIDVPQREMKKVYDLNNNLIYFSNRELRLESSRSSYAIYYEYEKE